MGAGRSTSERLQERPFKGEMALLLDIFHQIYRGVEPEELVHQVCVVASWVRERGQRKAHAVKALLTWGWEGLGGSQPPGSL